VNKTTCQAHRTEGYALSEGQWVCRACGLPERLHETFTETLARTAREANQARQSGEQP
jgi:hypothetical protein